MPAGIQRSCEYRECYVVLVYEGWMLIGLGFQVGMVIILTPWRAGCGRAERAPHKHKNIAHQVSCL